MPPPTSTTSTPSTTTTTNSSRTTGSVRLACGGAALGNDAAQAPLPARELEPLWRGHRSTQRKMCHCKTQKRRTTEPTATAWAYTSSEHSTWLSVSNNENCSLPWQWARPNCSRIPSSSCSSSSSLLPSFAARTNTTTVTTITTTEGAHTPTMASTRSSTAALAQRIPTMNEVWPCSSSSLSSFPVQTSGLGKVLTPSRISACADMADAGGLCDRYSEPYYVTNTLTQITTASSESGCGGGHQRKKRKKKKKKRRRRGNNSGDIEMMNANDYTQLHPAFMDWDHDSTDRLTGKVSRATQEWVNDDNTPLTAGRPMHADERLRVPPENNDSDSQEGNKKGNSDGGCAYSCWYPGTSEVKKVAKHVHQVPCWWLPWLWLRMWFTWWATWFRPTYSPNSRDVNNSKNWRKNSARSRGKWSSPAAKWIWLSLLLCSFVSFAQSQGVPEHGSDSSEAKGICGSMDIRNTPSNLEKLRNCRVIEGHLKFVLMEHVNASEFANYTFPELREITDYFMMYRVYGLKTLRHLFPNLAVIRGQSLFQNYAFVIFECNHLQDIALPSLTDISRGAVRIEKNPNLCYIDTVHWHSIAQTSGDTNFFKDNKPVETCPTRTSCPQNCPAPSEPRSRHCWSNNICQKFCICEKQMVCPLPANAISSTKSTSCCHPQCLGGCTGPGSNQCITCRNVSYQNQCKELCPPDTYLFNERRCLTDSECINQEPPESNGEHRQPWIPFEGICRRECPPGFQINETKSQNGAGLKIYSCVPCTGPCPKLCHGSNVDSIERAQALRGCTIITGALEIQVKGGENIVRELVENLSLIEEVQYYVKIVRSHPLVSLDFLKNLRKIGGEHLENNEYALVVLDNPNLQELWDWDRKGRNLTIEKGKLFFHFNPNLCYDKIVELQNITNKNDTDRRHISPTSNGDKAACKTNALELKVSVSDSEFAIIKWENYEKKMIDPRALLGYVVSYIEAPEQNLTYYSGRDACGGDGWRVDDYSAGDEKGSQIDYLMPNLEPATQYAVYVQTFTVASVDDDGRRVGARSPIVYFTTKPSKPSIPVQLKAFSNSSSEIVVTWKEPIKPNGKVTHYVITARWVEDDRELVDQRNYCSEPFMPDTGKASKGQDGQESRGVTISQPTNDDKGECCTCTKPKAKPTDAEFERDSQISFEDYVHNTIYIRRPDYDATRRKRDTSLSLGKEFPETPTKDTSIPTINETSPPIQRDSRGRYISFHFNVANATTYILRSLRHFAEYTIEIVACHDLDPDQLPKDKRCSDKAITTARTAPSPYADDIHEGIKAAVSNSTDQVKINWKEPEDPNGLIVNYHIEYRRVETDKLKKEVCVPRKDYILNGGGYVIASLAPGNYSAEIKATSLYGKSTRSSHVYFQIPEPSNVRTEVIISVIIGCVILLLAVVFSLYYVRKKMGMGEVTISRNPEYLPADGVYVQDEWEVPRDKIELLRELGQGSFGMVYEGVVKDMAPDKPIVKCAVKTVNKEASIRERIEFLNEASVMKAFDCNHVVRLLGVVSIGQPTLVVMELMANGDLKSYLRSHRPDNEENILHRRLPPTLRSVLQMATEIADGMSYLAAKKFVHRDLAARNCMVAEDLTVKVGDFGMTRDIYATDYYRKGGKGLLPVRWMSPESLKDGVFTSQSDVWSFGVVLWEMATLASQPYQGLANEQVLNYVMKGGVMEKPEGCPDRMFELMSSCWRFKASERPTFFEIVESLLSEAKPTFEQVSFYFSKEGRDARKDQKDLEEKHLRSSHSEDPSTPLLLTVAELGEREQVVEMEEQDEDEEDLEPEGEEHHEDDSDAGSHVRIMYPAGPVYVRALAGGPVGVIRDPSWDMQSHSNSRSDGSHSTGKTISSEGSKNSHNGSANGYVSGILQHRRNGPDCC